MTFDSRAYSPVFISKDSSIAFISTYDGGQNLNSYKSNINTCGQCGSISLGLNETCMNCGAELKNSKQRSQIENKPGESTIEIKAEEIK